MSNGTTSPTRKDTKIVMRFVQRKTENHIVIKKNLKVAINS